MWELAAKMLIAYLIGTVLGSLVLGRIRGIDIRRLGSGNAGATNALRTQGALFGVTVLIIDLAKGFLAVRCLPAAALPGVGADPALSREWLTLACAAFVILGHVYPVWFGFRGGKGAATVAGVVLALDWHLFVPLLGAWALVLVLTGYVGLATMLSGLALIGAALLLKPSDPALLAFCVAVTAFIAYTHRSNIARMRAGQEHRARRLWLLRPRTP